MRNQALPEPLWELGMQPTGDLAGTAPTLGTEDRGAHLTP